MKSLFCKKKRVQITAQIDATPKLHWDLPNIFDPILVSGISFILLIVIVNVFLNDQLAQTRLPRTFPIDIR